MRKIFLFVSSILIVYSTANATINVLVSTHHGFVIAADSRLTQSGPRGIQTVSDTCQKIVRIGRFVGVAFSGVAFLSDESGRETYIGSIISDYKLRKNINDTTVVSPRQVAGDLDEFLGQIYRRDNHSLEQDLLEVLVFGYDEMKSREIFKLRFAHPTSHLDSSRSLGSFVLGQRDVWHRLIKGYDARLTELLKDSCIQKMKGVLDSLPYVIDYEHMSLQDAMDFAVFIVRTTMDAQRFNQSGVKGVGGDIDVAIITPEGFKWIQQKKLHREREP